MPTLKNRSINDQRLSSRKEQSSMSMTAPGEPSVDSSDDASFSAFLDLLNDPPAEQNPQKDIVEEGEATLGGKSEANIKMETDMDINDADAAVPIDPNENSNGGKRRRLHQWMKFASAVLFVIGSVLYLVMAVKDFQWAHELQSLPMWLRTADDDIGWMNYRLGERYNTSSLLEEEEGEGAATSRSGGVRRMKSRELLILLEDEENQARRKISLAEETALEVLEGAPLGRIEAATSPAERKLQTPEELGYDDECWTDLPQGIEDAYTVLGWTEELWNAGGSASTDDFDWTELSAEQQEAALFIGYTEVFWCADEGGTISQPVETQLVTDCPTKQPTPKPVTNSPTKQPVTDSPSKSPTPKPFTGSPSNQPTPKPVMDRPTKQPTPKPVTDSPTEQPTTKPGTGSPTKQFTTMKPASASPESASQDFLWWSDLTEDQRYALTILGYDETLWNSGGTIPVDEKVWDEMSSSEKFGAFFLSFNEDSWDATAPGEHFFFQPSSTINIFVDETDAPISAVPTSTAPNSTSPTSAPTIVTLPPTVEPTKKQTEEPTTSEPSKRPTERPSLPPSSSPSPPPVTNVTDTTIPDSTNAGSGAGSVTATNTPASTSPTTAPVQNIQSPTPPTSLEVAPVDTTATDPEVPASPTPEELYYDEYWKDLPKDIQDAYAVLGVNETMWNKAIAPESDEMDWGELSPEMQEAALFIGYNEKIWCTTFAPTTSPTKVPASPTPDEYYDEYWKDLPKDIQGAYAVLGYNEMMWNMGIEPETNGMFWYELTPEQRNAALLIGYTEESWETTSAPSASPIASSTNATGTTASVFIAPEDNIDNVTNTEVVQAGYYDDYDWVELPPHIQDAAAALGYDQTLWEMDGISWSDDYFWDELTPEAQEAAALLGYDKYSWDGIDPITGAPVEDDYVSYDDDYVFQVGSSDVWVSQYQILYFFAALSFLIVGILDLIRERHAFHILMILAGAFGVISAVYVEEDIRLSNIFNSVSVHFYLLEALTLFGEHRRGAITVEVGKWMTFTMMLGDLEFIVGALFDVILSYFYVFDNAADWDVSLMTVSIVGAVLWLHCSFIYMGAFFYEYHEAKKNVATVEGREDNGSDSRDTENGGHTTATAASAASNRV